MYEDIYLKHISELFNSNMPQLFNQTQQFYRK